MDRSTALKLGIAAAVFGALFMALWLLGGMLIQSLQKVGIAPVVEGPDSPVSGPGARYRDDTPAKPYDLAPKIAPTQQQRDTIASLIEKLSADSYEERKAAEERLVEIGERAVPDLEQAAKRDDPETSWRAAEALRRIMEDRGADR